VFLSGIVDNKQDKETIPTLHKQGGKAKSGEQRYQQGL